MINLPPQAANQTSFTSAFIPEIDRYFSEPVTMATAIKQIATLAKATIFSGVLGYIYGRQTGLPAIQSAKGWAGLTATIMVAEKLCVTLLAQNYFAKMLTLLAIRVSLLAAIFKFNSMGLFGRKLTIVMVIGDSCVLGVIAYQIYKDKLS